ncbi:MAG: hypothetical protein HY904_11765 [Deltaproteobacteria bacterium]|nr:hypothetical protein [Deltaproteobacteria bacterium]
MVAVCAAFIGLSMLEGPPQMPMNERHRNLKEDPPCLTCHNWPDKLPSPLPEGFKPMSANHPPPRPKKVRPVISDGGANEAPPAPQFECLKCHRPH